MPRRDHAFVLGPAIRSDETDLVFSLPKPARHHDVIKSMVGMGIPAPIGQGRYTQGFMTPAGFKDRERTGALIGHKGLLTSEDLW